MADAVAVTPGGAALVWRAYEFDHRISAGASSQTGPVIPAGALVVGITGRVVDEITGTGITGWRIGVPNGLDRYGTGLGVQKNSYAVGLSGSPVAYYVTTPLHLQAEGGQFIGGRVRLCVCYGQLLPPRAV